MEELRYQLQAVCPRVGPRVVVDVDDGFTEAISGRRLERRRELRQHLADLVAVRIESSGIEADAWRCGDIFDRDVAFTNVGALAQASPENVGNIAGVQDPIDGQEFSLCCRKCLEVVYPEALFIIT